MDITKSKKDEILLNEQRKELEDAYCELSELNTTTEIQKQQLEKANVEKDRFLSILAHDLKSPFSGIIGFISMLNENYDGFSESKRKEFISIIHDSILNVYDLLEKLLEWARLQRGKIAFSPKILNLKQQIENVFPLTNGLALKKKLILTIDVDLNLQAFADPNMLETILRNLIINAIKFTEKGAIKVSASEQKDFILLEIKDTGIGMIEEDQKKLFRIDVQPSLIGNSKEKGTGLGLVLCKDFVVKNNGEIWVESKLDVGTSFFFSLPKGNSL